MADDLWPAIRARLAQDLPAAEVNALLTGTQQWRGGGPAVPEVVAVLERLSRRIDATGELGSRAGSAAPALRGMRDDPAEAGALRVAAADALWHITGDATGALPVLRHFANPSATTATTERAPVANEHDDDGALSSRAQEALRRIEHEIAAAVPGNEGDDDRPDPAG
ncbi:hypothetical protein [Streptomyces noursei]|uniref:hypothetical protein n=1 Tax=Streptomyces noursei TaxID=1971 RepID=UPI001673B57A|nr:hypothetical protein [Streptomyces noursei]MCZ1020110.1 hypothetical protein [Streptomyces noursei]